MKRIEYITEYLVDCDDLIYNDNHGRLVRCKDCKYQIRGKCYAGNIMEHRAKVQVAEHVKDDWFCADGEEKSDD